MHLYTEPVGFGWRKSGGIWRTDLVIDVVVKTATGEQLFQQSDFDKLQLASRVRNREFMAHVTYTLSGLPSGEYVCYRHDVPRRGHRQERHVVAALRHPVAPALRWSSGECRMR